ncbi:MAG: hypothetical protein PHD65_01680 [Gallionella sp.]|nr:hypothetical protein [Gallionella sp.]
MPDATTIVIANASTEDGGSIVFGGFWLAGVICAPAGNIRLCRKQFNIQKNYLLIHE